MYPFKQPSELIQALCDGTNDRNRGVLSDSNRYSGSNITEGFINNREDNDSMIKLTVKPSSPSGYTKVSALKSLKNLVIGNPKKKQLVAEMGVLPMYVCLLNLLLNTFYINSDNCLLCIISIS